MSEMFFTEINDFDILVSVFHQHLIRFCLLDFRKVPTKNKFYVIGDSVSMK